MGKQGSVSVELPAAVRSRMLPAEVTTSIERLGAVARAGTGA